MVATVLSGHAAAATESGDPRLDKLAWVTRGPVLVASAEQAGMVLTLGIRSRLAFLEHPPTLDLLRGESVELLPDLCGSRKFGGPWWPQGEKGQDTTLLVELVRPDGEVARQWQANWFERSPITTADLPPGKYRLRARVDAGMYQLREGVPGPALQTPPLRVSVGDVTRAMAEAEHRQQHVHGRPRPRLTMDTNEHDVLRIVNGDATGTFHNATPLPVLLYIEGAQQAPPGVATRGKPDFSTPDLLRWPGDPMRAYAFTELMRPRRGFVRLPLFICGTGEIPVVLQPGESRRIRFNPAASGVVRIGLGYRRLTEPARWATVVSEPVVAHPPDHP